MSLPICEVEGQEILASDKNTKHIFGASKMGTEFVITLYDSGNSEKAQAAAKAAYKRADELNSVFSDYDIDSEINMLVRDIDTSVFYPVSHDLYVVLRMSQQLSAISDGVFDVSIGPLSKLWRRAIRRNEFPAIEKIARAIEKVDYKSIELDSISQSVRFMRKDMKLDFGAIVKGYAADEMMTVINNYGFRRVLIDVGGDLLAGDPPPNTTGWKINLFECSSLEHTLIANEAWASSGSTFRYIEKDSVIYSHIIDPRTGLGIQNRAVVHIKSKSCAIADAVASILSIEQDEPRRIEILSAIDEVELMCKD